MLKRIDELIRCNKSFAFETTLAAKTYKNKLEVAKMNGYNVTLLFFWLQSIDLAKQRVKARVLSGGHNIDDYVIERRYVNGIKNLFDIYISIASNVLIIDNSEKIHQIIAKKTDDSCMQIIDNLKFNEIQQYYEHERI
jgi:predicted ABC-type ATPase